jgi:hypothetical protein
MNCCENFETDNICKTCGKPIIESYLGMLPKFGFSAIPILRRRIPRRGRDGKIRMVNYEQPIPFPAAFHVAVNSRPY